MEKYSFIVFDIVINRLLIDIYKIIFFEFVLRFGYDKNVIMIIKVFIIDSEVVVVFKFLFRFWCVVCICGGVVGVGEEFEFSSCKGLCLFYIMFIVIN